MRFIDKLERRFRRFGISNLMIYITATMLAVYVLGTVLRAPVYSLLAFSRADILQGQVWRILSFVFLPPNSRPLFLLISLYFYYFIGSTLENAWGSCRFTIYYIFGIVGAIAAGFITGFTTNYYLNMSLFFAFATLYPDQQVLLFFIIPIKIKYLAYLDAALFVFQFFSGGISVKVTILFSLLNYFIFFGPDIVDKIRTNRRYSKGRREFRKQSQQNRDIWR